MFEMNKKDQANAGSDQPADTKRATASSAATPVRSGESAVIGHSIHIEGDLRGEEDLRIEGKVNGTIQLPNHSLTIGKEGRVKADAYAKTVTVDGQAARVTGNVVASRVSVEEGAHFKGSIDMDPETVEAALGKKSGSQASSGAKSASPAAAKAVGAQNISDGKKSSAEQTH
jgi:cytoskeletal protein CcmA (bactofilin family)